MNAALHPPNGPEEIAYAETIQVILGFCEKMKAGLILVGVWSLCLLCLSLLIVGAFDPLHARTSYAFTWPFIIFAALCVIVAIVGLVAKRARSTAFWTAAPLHGLLCFPYHFAMSQWPGGDDGAGMAWMYLVGWGSYIASLLAIVLIVVVLMTGRKKPQAEPVA